MIIFFSMFLRMRNVSDKSRRYNQNTHILCLITFFRKSCRLWDNMEKYGRARQATDDNITRRMRIACWITKAADTLWICNTYWFPTATVVTRTRLNVTFVSTLPVLFIILDVQKLYVLHTRRIRVLMPIRSTVAYWMFGNRHRSAC
jgi:hypothetical protein